MGVYFQQPSLWDKFKGGLTTTSQAVKDLMGFAGGNGSIPSFYQVKKGDTMGGVSSNLNVPLANLVDANNGMKALPPVGSHIATGVEAQRQFYSQGQSYAQQAASVPATSSVPAAAPVSNAGAGAWMNTGQSNAEAWMAANPGTNTANSFSPTGNYRGGGGNFPATLDFVTRQFNAYMNGTGTLPFAVSDQAMVATGQTPQSLMSVGYVKNPVTGDWVIDPKKTGQGKPDPYSEVRSVAIRHDNGRVKYITPEEAALRNRQRRKHANDKVVTPAEADNAASTPTTTLNVQIGSG